MGTVYNFSTLFSTLRLEPPLTEEFVTLNNCAYVNSEGFIVISESTKNWDNRVERDIKRILRALTKGEIKVICIDEYDQEFSLITGKAGKPELTIKTYNLSLENDELRLEKVEEKKF